MTIFCQPATPPGRGRVWRGGLRLPPVPAGEPRPPPPQATGGKILGGDSFGRIKNYPNCVGLISTILFCCQQNSMLCALNEKP